MEVPPSLCPILDAHRLSRVFFARGCFSLCEFTQSLHCAALPFRESPSRNNGSTCHSTLCSVAHVIRGPIASLLRVGPDPHLRASPLSPWCLIYERTNFMESSSSPPAVLIFTGSSPCPLSRSTGLGTEPRHNKCGPGPLPLNPTSASCSFMINLFATPEEFGSQI